MGSAGLTPPEGLPGRPGGSVARVIATTANVTALIANARVRSAAAMMIPASAGPTMNDSSPRVANRLLAGPSSRSSRTRLGRYAPIAGRKKHEKQVAKIARPTTARSGPSLATMIVSATMIRPRATSVTSSTSRRSKRSTMIPAGTERSTYGMIRAAPTMPRSSGSWLSL